MRFQPGLSAKRPPRYRSSTVWGRPARQQYPWSRVPAPSRLSSNRASHVPASSRLSSNPASHSPPLPGSQRTARHVLYPFTPTSVSIRTYGVIPTASRARTHFGTETRNCHSKVPAGLHSYRGNYEDLAIGSEHGYSVKVRDFINLLRSTSTRAARANNSEEL